MVRIAGKESIYRVAELFRKRCLVQGSSLLWPNHHSWSAENLATLWEAFIGHPDEGKRTFFEKWKDQLSSQPKDIHRIAADIIVIYCLFPYKMSYSAKIKCVNEVISWKLSDELPELELVKEAFSDSIGFPGPFYHAKRPWQIAFYIEFCRRIRLGEADPLDYKGCKQVADIALKEVPGNAKPARHILLHLLFPDYFERIVSDRNKHKIVNVFREHAENNQDIDDALASIRKNLTQRLNRSDSDFDFYNDDIKSQWQDISRPVITREVEKVPTWWIEKTYVEGNADRIEGEYALGKALWSPQSSKGGADIYHFMRDIKADDIILHLTDNSAFTGFSRVASSYEEFDGVADTEWGEGPSYCVRLRDFTQLNPPLLRAVFFSPPYSKRLVELIERGQENLFYNREPNLNQGHYLTPAPPELVAVLDDAYRSVSRKTLSEIITGTKPEDEGEDKEKAQPQTWASIKGMLAYDFEDRDFDIKELYFEDKAKSNLVRQIKTTLKNGKHIILIGPPGTGKSKLAKEICQCFCGANNFTMATATSDWSTFETIGGYRPWQNGELRFFPGLFLQCFQDTKGSPINNWLIIDELNRADIDKAFGSLFSALTGDNVTLPFEIDENRIEIIGQPRDDMKIRNNLFMVHPHWRMIATMNTYDKSSLYEMSYAFMRRLAFIPVEVPYLIDTDLIGKYVEKWGLEQNDEICANVAELWNVVNRHRKIGPAIVEDIYKYAHDTAPIDYSSAVVMYVLPQFEGLMEQQAVSFIKQTAALNFITNKDELISFAADFFSIEEGKFRL